MAPRRYEITKPETAVLLAQRWVVTVNDHGTIVQAEGPGAPIDLVRALPGGWL